MASIEALTEASEAAILSEIVDPGRAVTPEQYVARKRIAELGAQNAKLREFASDIITDYCWGYGQPDGGGVQDLAEKLGLIVASVATAEDATEDIEPGDTIYKFADWMKS